MKNRGPVKADIFVGGIRVATRSYHCVPRIGEEIVIGKTDDPTFCMVQRVIYLIPSKDAEAMGWQEVDIYTSTKGGAA